ncbi:unnamed protein product, partial [Amoebophrya sp. A25]
SERGFLGCGSESDYASSSDATAVGMHACPVACQQGPAVDEGAAQRSPALEVASGSRCLWDRCGNQALSSSRHAGDSSRGPVTALRPLNRSYNHEEDKSELQSFSTSQSNYYIRESSRSTPAPPSSPEDPRRSIPPPPSKDQRRTAPSTPDDHRRFHYQEGGVPVLVACGV